MPVVLTSVTLPILTSDDVRLFLRDFPQFNLLLDQVQFTNSEISKAVDFTVDNFNVIPPITSFSADIIPKSLLLIGTVSWLLRSESFLQVRNQVTYSDGDISPIGIDDKAGLYSQLARELRDQFQIESQKFKIADNMSKAYGSVGSGYRWSPRS